MTQPRKWVGSVKVSIATFQAVDLGSIPGQRRLSKVLYFLLIWILENNG